MASLLYRLGRFAFRKRWWFVSFWLVILTAVGASAGMFMGALSNSFNLPGTPSQITIDRMKEVFPEDSGGGGAVVFETEDGTAFSAQQRKAISDTIASLDGRYQVSDMVDPFKQQKDIDQADADIVKGQQEIEDGVLDLEKAKKDLADGERALADGRKEIVDNEKLLADAQQQITNGQTELDAARGEWQTGNQQYQDGLAQAAAGATEIAAAEQELATQQNSLNAITKDLAAQGTELDAGQRELDEAYSTLYSAVGASSRAEFDKILASLPDGQEKTELTATVAELDAQQKELDGFRSELAAGLPEVAAGQAELDAAAKEIAAQRAVLAEAEQELADAKSQLDAGASEIAEGERVLTESRAEVETGKAELEQARRDLITGEKELADGRVEIADGEKELADARAEMTLGKRDAAAVSGMRFVSEDGSAAVSQLSFLLSLEDLPEQDLNGAISVLDTLEEHGINVLYSADLVTSLESLIGVGEIVGIGVAAIVLLIMMGTLVAAGLPILTSLIGVGVGVGGTLALSSVIEMTSITPMLALMLGLAVGIDYTLFIAHRHRKQMLSGMEPEQSVGLAVGTSGNAVVFAGLTVVIALAALIIPGLPFLSVLGVSAAVTVAISVLVSITLTPALLGFIGSRLCSKRAYAKARADAAVSQPAEPKLPFATRRPWLTAMTTVLLLGIVAIPALSMRTALPDGGQEPLGSTAQQAYETVSEKFGPGHNGPLVALVEFPEPLTTKDEAMHKLHDVADQIRPTDGVVAVLPLEVNTDRTAGLLQILPAGGPASEETEHAVTAIRDTAADIEAATGSTVDLAGSVAAQIDVSEKLANALAPYLAIVVGLSMLLLLLVFRSIIVPLLATAGFLLSLAAAFGSAVAIYQWGWLGEIFGVHAPGPVLSFLPILLTGILFGLAMDYQVFLVSAMREAYAHGQRPTAAIRSGLRTAAPVVIAAALIMAAVFAGFIHSELAMIRPLGFALAIGVLADAFIVRMLLTPAIMTLLGDRAWYIPRWLDRILPDVDVEGAKLTNATPTYVSKVAATT